MRPAGPDGTCRRPGGRQTQAEHITAEQHAPRG
jgi:hypothetical protein